MPSATATPPASSGRTTWGVLLLVAAVTVSYSNSFRGVFLLDDTRSIVENRRIHRLWPPRDMLSGPRPIVDLTLAVNYAISGVKPWSYHAVNLAVHLLATLTLFGLVRRTLRRLSVEGGTDIAFAAALLWAVHPLQTQAVTYIIQRSESMMGLFYLLTLYCFVRGTESNHRRFWYAGAAMACALGMGSKAVMVTAPIVVLLYDRALIAPNWGDVFRRRWGAHLALMAAWSVLVMTGVFHGILETSTKAHSTVGFGVARSTPVEYAQTQAGVLPHYLRLVFWPHPLCLDYAWPITRNISDAVLPLIGTALLGAATLWAWVRRPALGFLGAAFFLILAPTSSFVPIQDAAVEHRMYLPLAAVVLLVVLAAHRIVHRGAAAAILLLLAASALAAATFQRNGDYASSVEMWRDVVEHRPRNGRAYNNLGNALVAANRAAEAVPYFEQALRLVEPSATVHYSFGAALAASGRPQEAIAQYQEALRLFPEHAKAQNNLGMLMAGQRRFDEAIAHFEAAVRIDPTLSEARYNLALALNAVGRVREAIEQYRLALRDQPDNAAWHNNLAAALTQLRLYDDAMKEFGIALRLDPKYFNARFNLGCLYENQGLPGQAANQYLEALKIRPDHVDARRRLNAVLQKMKAASQPS